MLHTVPIDQCLKSSKQNTYRQANTHADTINWKKETVFSYRFSFCKIDATVWVENTYQTLSWPVTACVTFVTFHKHIIYCATKKARDQRKTNESLQFHQQKFLLKRKVHQLSKYKVLLNDKKISSINIRTLMCVDEVCKAVLSSWTLVWSFWFDKSSWSCDSPEELALH